MILSTKLAGLEQRDIPIHVHCSRQSELHSYIYPDVSVAGAGLLLSETFTALNLNLSEGGHNMYDFSTSLVYLHCSSSADEFVSCRYDQMTEWLGRPAPNVPRQPVTPLEVSISKTLREYLEAKYKKAGAEKGKFAMIRGIESDSAANMHSKGDTDNLLPIEAWAE